MLANVGPYAWLKLHSQTCSSQSLIHHRSARRVFVVWSWTAKVHLWYDSQQIGRFGLVAYCYGSLFLRIQIFLTWKRKYLFVIVGCRNSSKSAMYGNIPLFLLQIPASLLTHWNFWYHLFVRGSNNFSRIRLLGYCAWSLRPEPHRQLRLAGPGQVSPIDESVLNWRWNCVCGTLRALVGYVFKRRGGVAL